jgi:uncharacterized protein (TIGR00369 family)
MVRHSPAQETEKRLLPEQPLTAPTTEPLRGFNKMLGFRLAEWRDGFARMELDIDERHLNRSGILHGGVLSTLLDATLGYCGIYPLDPNRRRRAVTLSMTTMFLGQAKSGTLVCTAERRGGCKTVFMATGEVRGSEDRLLATADGVFRYIADEVTS